jgi:hypothetical protein
MKLEKDNLNGYWFEANKETFAALLAAGCKKCTSEARYDQNKYLEVIRGVIYNLADTDLERSSKQAYHHNGNFYTIDGGFAEEKELTYDENQKAVEPFSITEVEQSIVQETFTVTKADVGDFSTSFTISNGMSSMSPEAFIHTLGEMAGKSLGGIKGLRFDVTIEKEADLYADIKAEYEKAKEAERAGGPIVKLEYSWGAKVDWYETGTFSDKGKLKKDEDMSYQLRYYEINWSVVQQFTEVELSDTSDFSVITEAEFICTLPTDDHISYLGFYQCGYSSFEYCRLPKGTEIKDKWLREIKHD